MRSFGSDKSKRPVRAGARTNPTYVAHRGASFPKPASTPSGSRRAPRIAALGPKSLWTRVPKRVCFQRVTVAGTLERSSSFASKLLPQRLGRGFAIRSV